MALVVVVVIMRFMLGMFRMVIMIVVTFVLGMGFVMPVVVMPVVVMRRMVVVLCVILVMRVIVVLRIVVMIPMIVMLLMFRPGAAFPERKKGNAGRFRQWDDLGAFRQSLDRVFEEDLQLVADPDDQLRLLEGCRV